MDVLRPGFEAVKDIKDEAERTRALEHEAVKVSLTNLMTFPFVKSAVDQGTLTLHGLWNEIAEGRLMQYDAAKDAFVPV